jgi:hypothetical protein
MANPWFRLYSEFDSDPKVQSMSEAMQRRLVMLMCAKCRGETLHETLQAFHWRISALDLAETKEVFLANGFIDKSWNLLNWNKRQFLSDSSTDRVQKHRAMKRMKRDETKITVSPSVSPSDPHPHKQRTETQRNVTVTAPDTETDTEHKQLSLVQIATAPPRNGNGHSRHARFTSSDVESVYAEYPRKVGRGAALKAIMSALHRIDDPDPVAVLIRVTREFARSPAGQRGEFTPHPATFYNHSRYLDDPEEWERVR